MAEELLFRLMGELRIPVFRWRPENQRSGGIPLSPRPDLANSCNPGSCTMEADIVAWESELRRKSRSADYQRRGPSLIRTIRDEFAWKTSADASPVQLSAWLAEQGGSGHSQNNRLSMLREYFRFCERVRKSVPMNPASELDRASDATGDGVREFVGWEMAAIYAEAEGHWKTAVGIFATTALRRGAVFKGILCGWFDEQRQALVIPPKFLKNKRPQTIPLNADAMAVMRAATQGRHPGEFIVPIGFDQATWLGLLERAGVSRYDSRGRPAGTHSFRKGVITALADAGVHPKVAQELAGHGDIRQTMRIYTRLGDNRQVEAVKKLPPLTHSRNGTCATPLGSVADFPAKCVAEIENISDTDPADLEGTLMVANHAHPDQKSRLCIAGSFSDQQSADSVTSDRGRLFQSRLNDPTGICLPLGGAENPVCSAPTGLPETAVIDALGRVPLDRRKALLTSLLTLCGLAGLAAGVALLVFWGEGGESRVVDRVSSLMEARR